MLQNFCITSFKYCLISLSSIDDSTPVSSDKVCCWSFAIFVILFMVSCSMYADPILSNILDSSNRDFLMSFRKLASAEIEMAEQYRPTNIRKVDDPTKETMIKPKGDKEHVVYFPKS